MQAYIQLALASMKRQAAYRVASLAGMVTNLFFGFFRAYLLLAVLGQRGEIAGYNRAQLLVYVALTQAVLPILGTIGWWDLIKAVRAGEIIMDYCKPIDLYGMWQARDAGRAAYSLIFRSIPLMALFQVFFGIGLHRTPAVWAAFALSMLLAWAISFAWRFIYNTMSFWTVDAVGVASIMNSLSWILMGFIIPVSFFPPWLKAVANLTPFPSMLDTPNEILLGIARGPEIWRGILVQAAWTLLMVMTARFLGRQGLKKVVIQGG